MVWDLRMRSSVQKFESSYAITAVSFSADEELVFTAGIDNVVKAWDRRREAIVFTLEGHTGRDSNTFTISHPPRLHPPPTFTTMLQIRLMIIIMS